MLLFNILGILSPIMGIFFQNFLSFSGIIFHQWERKSGINFVHFIFSQEFLPLLIRNFLLNKGVLIRHFFLCIKFSPLRTLYLFYRKFIPVWLELYSCLIGTLFLQLKYLSFQDAKICFFMSWLYTTTQELRTKKVKLKKSEIKWLN